MSVDVGQFGWQVTSLDTILKRDHLRTIPLKFGPNRLSVNTSIITIGSYVKTMSVDVGCLGWRAESLDTILKGDHLIKDHSFKVRSK